MKKAKSATELSRRFGVRYRSEAATSVVSRFPGGKDGNHADEMEDWLAFAFLCGFKKAQFLTRKETERGKVS